jgi:molecular chaperone GrpE
VTDPHQAGAEGVEDPLGPPADPALDPADASDGSPAPAVAPDDAESASVEQLIADLEEAAAKRDEFLDTLRRTQADFENYRKRVAKQQADDIARAAEGLVEELLPVLDACDGAIHHGATEVEPVYAALLGTLEKQGLARIDPGGEPFDPTLHEAVMHEPAGEGDDGTIVSAVMRPGYSWKGRVIRPAMVKVRG